MEVEYLEHFDNNIIVVKKLKLLCHFTIFKTKYQKLCFTSKILLQIFRYYLDFFLFVCFYQIEISGIIRSGNPILCGMSITYKVLAYHNSFGFFRLQDNVSYCFRLHPGWISVTTTQNVNFVLDPPMYKSHCVPTTSSKA